MPFVTEECWSRLPGARGAHGDARARRSRRAARSRGRGRGGRGAGGRHRPARLPLQPRPAAPRPAGDGPAAPPPAVAALDAVEPRRRGARRPGRHVLLADGRSISVGPLAEAVEPGGRARRGWRDELAKAESERDRAEAQAGRRRASSSGRPAHLVEAEREKAARYAAERERAGRAASPRSGVTPEPGRPAHWIAGLEILGMRFGLERMRRLLARARATRSGPRRPSTWWARTASRRPPGSRGRARRRGPPVGAVPVAPRHGLDRADPVDGEPIDEDAFAAAVERECARRPRAWRWRRATPSPSSRPSRPRRSGRSREAGVGRGGVEAGLGGRYDATNVLRPTPSSALTNIALEHTEFLGDTEEAIAAEKLAVAADGADRAGGGARSPAAARDAVDAECARRRPAAPALRRRSGRAGSPGGGGGDDPEGGLPGAPPAARGGLPAGQPGRRRGRGASWLAGGAARPRALRRPWPRVRMPGRLEVVGTPPPFVLDGAHNPAGMAAWRRSPEVLAGRRPGGGGLGAGRQGRRRDARRARGRRRRRSSPPARATPGRRRRRTSPPCARGVGIPARAVGDPGGGPPRGPRWTGPGGAVAGGRIPVPSGRSAALRRARPVRNPLLESRAPGRAPTPPRRNRLHAQGISVILGFVAAARQARARAATTRSSRSRTSSTRASGARSACCCSVFVVLLWLALVYWTYQDARRRIEAPALIAACVALSVLIPFLGTIIYLIVRPPEYLDEARERELELLALEQRLGRAGRRRGEGDRRPPARPRGPPRPTPGPRAGAAPGGRGVRTTTCGTWICA